VTAVIVLTGCALVIVCTALAVAALVVRKEDPK